MKETFQLGSGGIGRRIGRMRDVGVGVQIVGQNVNGSAEPICMVTNPYLPM